MKLRICHLYPDILNLYGDQGNILCLKRRLEWRNIDCDVTEVSIGERPDFADFDLFFIGGGQDFEDGKTYITICGGYQMLGRYYKTWDGQMNDFIGAIDYYTEGSKDRMIGNFMYRCLPESGGSTVVGFENHSGKTYLGQDIKPLGTILSGYGNNGEDKTEGVRYKNVFGTYSHGPLLPKNPLLTDFILKTTLERKYGKAELIPLHDTFELNANTYMKNRLTK